MHNGKKYRAGATSRIVSESVQTAKREGRDKPTSMNLRLVVLENIETKKRVGIFTNNEDKPVHCIAHYMLSRWGDSENVFKKMMARFNLNYHPGYDIKELENQPLVDNPDIVLIKKAIRALNREVEELKRDILVIEAKQHRKSDKRRIEKRSKLEKELTQKMEDIAGFEQKLSQLPEKLSIVQVLKGKPISRCDLEKKRLYDLVQFMAYNSRERLAEIFRKCYDDPRDVFQVLDMITGREGYIKLSGQTLIVVLDWIESKKHREAAKKFCHRLNQEEIRMEGHMNLKLSFHISRYPIHGSARQVHNQI
jgi:predicted transcriptional regulator with HTH domain